MICPQPLAPWIPCPCCDCYLCTLHGLHAHDCECPPVEEWDESPYGTIGDDDMPTKASDTTRVRDEKRVSPRRQITMSEADWDALDSLAGRLGTGTEVRERNRSAAVRFLLRDYLKRESRRVARD